MMNDNDVILERLRGVPAQRWNGNVSENPDGFGNPNVIILDDASHEIFVEALEPSNVVNLALVRLLRT